MASITEVSRKRKGNRRRGSKTDGTLVMYKVRYRDPDRKERSRTFHKKIDAEEFARSVETDISRGDYLDPSAGKVTLGHWAEEWLATTRHLKPKTQEGYEGIIRKHILPKLGNRSLSSVRPIDIRRFISEMVDAGYSASRVRQARHLLGMLFTAAVENRAIPSSPVVGVKIPREQRREMQVLTAEQVRAVADNVSERYRALIYLLAYGGLRWGEAAALRRGKINVMRSRIEVSESVAETSKGLHYGATKTYQTRSVAIPAFLKDMLAEHLATFVDKGRDALVFTTEAGAPLRNNNWRSRVWEPALRDAGLPKVRIHDLRHSCATLLIAQGAHAKAIQRHLGHSSIQITFDTYGHLLPDEQDRVADALDATFRGSAPARR
ncbi:MAG: tyrosine-type recombinase/integrase [Actinomycetota bacterium]